MTYFPALTTLSLNIPLLPVSHSNPPQQRNQRPRTPQIPLPDGSSELGTRLLLPQDDSKTRSPHFVDGEARDDSGATAVSEAVGQPLVQ